MVKSDQKDTEQQILDTARDVFYQKGYDGARMADIAKEAGINKALLHYYYRSKEKLFQTVFEAAFGQVIKTLTKIFDINKPLPELVESFVHQYIDMIRSRPYLPGFVLHELTRSPQHLKSMVDAHFREHLAEILPQLQEKINREYHRPIELPHFMANMIALSIFPFVAKPILVTIFEMDKKAFDAFIEARKKEVVQLILNQ